MSKTRPFSAFIMLLSLLVTTLVGASLQAEAEATSAINPDPVSSWDFNEGTGFDVSGGGSNPVAGVVLGASWNLDLRAPIVNNNASLFFDGVNDRVRASGDTPLRVDDALTLAAWIYARGAGSHPDVGGIIIAKAGEYEIARFADGSLGWAVANTTPGWSWTDTNVIVPENEWTHVAFVYSAAEGLARMYVNGSEAHSMAVVGAIGDFIPAQNQFQIGARQDEDQHFDGGIDDVRFYDVALNSAEIAQLASRTSRNCSVPSAEHTTVRAAVTDLTCETVNIAAGDHFVTNIPVTHDVVVEGVGQEQTKLLADNDSVMARAFINESQQSLTLRDLAITRRFTEDDSPEGGGVINRSQASLTVENVAFFDNDWSTGTGSAIQNFGNMTVQDSLFHNNLSGNGGAIYAVGGTGAATLVDVRNSTFSNNRSTSSGGAIFAVQNVSLLVSGSTFSGNEAVDSGGAVAISGGVTGSMGNIIFRNNSAESTGGAINAVTARYAVFDSLFEDNSAVRGGGVAATNSEVGIWRSLFFNNSAVSDGGGAYFSDCGFSSVFSSTFSGNGAQTGGGAYVKQDGPCGRSDEPREAQALGVTISASTFANNRADANQGAGLYSIQAIVLQYTLFDNADDGTNCALISTSPVAHEGSGHNLFTDGGCGLLQATDIVNTDPMLGTLQDNGGFTWTHAISAESPAYQARPCAGRVGSTPLDQRGVERKLPLCDIGAFELVEYTVFLPMVSNTD